MNLTVVLATRNEQGNILHLQEKFKTHFKDDLPNLLYVDDSNDLTPHIIEGSFYPNKQLYHRETRDRDGLLGAIVHGIVHSNSRWIAVMDADGQHPVETLAQMWTVSQLGSDYVAGSRYISGGSNKGLSGQHRKFASEILRHIPIWSLGLPVSDPLTNFCLFDSTQVDVQALYSLVRPRMMRIQPAVLCCGEFRNVTEIPFTFGERYAEKSKMSSSALHSYFQEMVWLNQFKHIKPQVAYL